MGAEAAYCQQLKQCESRAIRAVHSAGPEA